LAGINAGADHLLERSEREELAARVEAILRFDRCGEVCRERERADRILERSRDGFLTLSREGRILRGNHASRSLLCLGGEPFEGALVGDLFRSPEGNELDGRWESLLVEGRRLLLPRFREGREGPLWVELERVDEGDDRTCLVRVSDVTEQVESRRQRWTFHALAGHKLRTPLSVALGHLQRLNAIQPSEHLRVAVGAMWRLTDAVTEVLRYVGAVGWGEGRCPFGQAETLAREAAERYPTLTLEVEPGSDRDVPIPLAPEAVELILAELLSNSVKFHPQCAPRVRLSLERTVSGGLRIRVDDDGIRPDPEALRRGLDSYWQGEERFTGEAKGMGLGLSLVATFVTGAGGAIRFVPRPDRPGARVEFSFPPVAGPPAGE
jgi:signal transduction histidine kinase